MTISLQLSCISLVVLLSVTSNLADGSSIGVCYGMLGDNLPSPREVIAMYKDHGIRRLRLYDPNLTALEALRDSGIEVLVGVTNQDIPELASSYTSAQDWVARNIKPFWPQVRFRYITVGNEVIPGPYDQHILSAMINMQNALETEGLWDHVKVSTSVPPTVMGVSYPPSAGAFSEGNASVMVPIASYLSSISAPLMVNVYPYIAYIGDPIHISLDYAMFTSKNGVVQDGELSYYNLFDAMVDAVHASLEKAGAAAVPVVVSETGWPSAGYGEVTTAKLARRYNRNLIRHVMSNKGTPRWPGEPIETYLFAMLNENMKPGADVERNWGLFYPNKSHVYPIHFT